MSVRILRGDVRDRLRDLPDESVHCVVTSPPYWGLRDYGHAGQIGLEDDPSSFIDALVGVFAEVRRVLRADGTAWVNMGDTYSSGDRATWRSGASENKGQNVQNDMPRPRMPSGIKPKDLIGVPWRLAFALQADGWYLRQDIIWHKPNPMPESVRDRCTKAHEYLFLLAKSERYYYDAAAIAEPATDQVAGNVEPQDAVPGMASHNNRSGLHTYAAKMRARKSEGTPRNDGERWNENNGRGFVTGTTRNKRSVWTVNTHAFPEAHFATFPPALIEPCILAGCPPGGVVLDPFGGAGTTGLVADRLQRDAILIELNPAYADMAERRIRGDAPLFAQVGS